MYVCMYVCMYVTVKLCVLWAGGEVEFMESANPNLIWQKLASEAVRLLYTYFFVHSVL